MNVQSPRGTFGNLIEAVSNAAFRRIETMFPGYFAEAKHNHYTDYGWPTVITAQMLYQMYSRNGLATAAVEKTILKSWQDNPELWETEDPKETLLEQQIRQKFDDLRLWQKMAEADRRALVGKYAGVVLRLADGQTFDKPVTTAAGGLGLLVEVIPVWSMQLVVAEWDMDQASMTYGLPKMYQFSEAAFNAGGDTSMQPSGTGRSFRVHPDRVIIWSSDGTLNTRSLLEPGYNDLMTLEKVSGAGGEGFWKNAKANPVLEMDKEASISDMARAMQVEVSEVVDAMNEQVSDWQRGLDKTLMLQGIKATTLPVNLPSPEHFFDIALQSFAASVPIPLKILVGMQTGERASTEDAKEWNQTNKARRVNSLLPTIRDFIRRLERFGVIPRKDWVIHWADLTGATMDEKLAVAHKMADVNAKASATRELIFLPEEIRAAVDLEPLSDADMRAPYDTEDDPAAMPPDPLPTDQPPAP